MLSRAFDVDLLHIAEHFSIPVSEIAVNWHEIPGIHLHIVNCSCLAKVPLWVLTHGHLDCFIVDLETGCFLCLLCFLMSISCKLGYYIWFVFVSCFFVLSVPVQLIAWKDSSLK